MRACVGVRVIYYYQWTFFHSLLNSVAKSYTFCVDENTKILTTRISCDTRRERKRDTRIDTGGKLAAMMSRRKINLHMNKRCRRPYGKLTCQYNTEIATALCYEDEEVRRVHVLSRIHELYWQCSICVTMFRRVTKYPPK